MPLPDSVREASAGLVAREEGFVKRVIMQAGKDDYEHYMSSGLHRTLAAMGQALEHEEEPAARSRFGSDAYKALVPEPLAFISYPYEWTFDQLKDAALLTLDIQETALAHGMSLKAAPAANVQFRGASPVFIDPLAFERDRSGPWLAYEQFCREFLAPLLLMRYNAQGRRPIAGLSLEQVSRMLPAQSYLNPDALIHIHLRARAGSAKVRAVRSLRRAVGGMRPPRSDNGSVAGEGDGFEARQFKAEAVRGIAARLQPSLVYDIGAGAGSYSSDALNAGAYCIGFDPDDQGANRTYLAAKQAGVRRLLPLVMDPSNPGAGLRERARPDLAMLLGSAPLVRVAELLSGIARCALVELAPKSESEFRAFEQRFRLEWNAAVPGSGRSLCLFTREEGARPL